VRGIGGGIAITRRWRDRRPRSSRPVNTMRSGSGRAWLWDQAFLACDCLNASSLHQFAVLRGRVQNAAQTRAFIVAWAFTVIFYFLEYAVRSSPAVMIPELETSFHTTALGLSAILGAYYYTYSTMSRVAGAALDHLGAKRTVPIGAAILGIGCLFFSAASVSAGDTGRLLQGAGSAFAFTGAVYLAAHGFSARYLATAIGATQCVGMLGGSAGQFVVGSVIEHGLNVRHLDRPRGHHPRELRVLVLGDSEGTVWTAHARRRFWFAPQAVQDCFFESQSYLCGLVAGLLFAPTTIGDMIWGVASFQKDLQFSYHNAVLVEASIRGLLRRRRLRTQFLPGHNEHHKSRREYRLRRPRFTEYKQSRHSAGHVRLAADFLEERETRRAAVLHAIFLSHSRALVCGSGRSQECASQHGLCRRSLRFAVNFRHSAACALPQLTLVQCLVFTPIGR
jgi:MFS family permease